MEHLPESFDLEAIRARVDEPSPYAMVAIQARPLCLPAMLADSMQPLETSCWHGCRADERASALLAHVRCSLVELYLGLGSACLPWLAPLQASVAQTHRVLLPPCAQRGRCAANSVRLCCG